MVRYSVSKSENTHTTRTVRTSSPMHAEASWKEML